MTIKLLLHNPSHYSRGGYVTTPWQPIHAATGLDAERVAVFDADGAQLDTQVHRADPEDPSCDVLVFWLNEKLRPGFEDYTVVSAAVTVGERRHEVTWPRLTCETEGPQGGEHRVTLSNERLKLRFELSPAPWDDGRNWYAGSATTVLLKPDSPDGTVPVLDMLDSFNWFDVHDLEKRCMQVDRVRLSLPAWSREPWVDFDPVRLPYRLLSVSEGPVRASVCVASSPFSYSYAEPRGGQPRTVSCRLRRLISLYRDANYATDELSVRATQPGGDPLDLFFKARYFMRMDLGRDGKPSRHFRIWDWFGICSDYSPRPAFGFATDAHCSPVLQGPDDYPYHHNKDKVFSWELERADWALCLHIFSRCGARAIEGEAGTAWYEKVYRPLWAEIAGDPAAASHASRSAK
jgi:hypothetical protein